MTEVILVNDRDEAIGSMEKMTAHETGQLHRAFSVFIFNNKGQMLLQRRALSKYHSGGLWTNSCCSHPAPGESTEEAAHRRLKEEMGFDCEIKHLFSFQYKASLDKGLTEHELDHVFIGEYNAAPVLNSEEADDYKYEDTEKIVQNIRSHPERYTAWFLLCFDKVMEHKRNNV